MKKEIIVPAAGESVTEADIAGWSKSSGDYVEVDEQLVELETDKASLPLNAEIAGILTISIEDGTVQVGDVLGYIEASDKKPADAPKQETSDAPDKEQSAPATPSSTSYAAGHPSPAAGKILAGKNIDPAHVSGTGRDGRITKADALAASSSPAAPEKESAPKEKPKSELPPLPSASKGSERGTRSEKMSRIRRTIAQRLVDVQHSSALLTTFNEVDVSQVKAIRAKYKDAFKDKHNVGLGFMSFFTKAAAVALQEYPVINAQVKGDEVLYHDYCDIGIAVATPKGLVVPVVRDAQDLSFSEVESTILHYALKGRNGQLTPQDMEGGTFTITNGGVFGSMLSTPIVNQPQSAILGMHNIVDRPVVVDGEIKVRPIMYLALTYDHRIIDGAEAVRFLVKIKELIEDPHRLLIGL